MTHASVVLRDPIVGILERANPKFDEMMYRIRLFEGDSDFDAPDHSEPPPKVGSLV